MTFPRMTTLLGSSSIHLNSLSLFWTALSYCFLISLSLIDLFLFKNCIFHRVLPIAASTTSVFGGGVGGGYHYNTRGEISITKRCRYELSPEQTLLSEHHSLEEANGMWNINRAGVIHIGGFTTESETLEITIVLNEFSLQRIRAWRRILFLATVKLQCMRMHCNRLQSILWRQ